MCGAAATAGTARAAFAGIPRFFFTRTYLDVVEYLTGRGLRGSRLARRSSDGAFGFAQWQLGVFTFTAVAPRSAAAALVTRF